MMIEPPSWLAILKKTTRSGLFILGAHHEIQRDTAPGMLKSAGFPTSSLTS